jgi:iron complex outermembrane receptor protein
MFRPLLQPALYTSTALSLFVAMPVFAQSDAVRAAPQEADDGFSDIVVTARRKEESLQEVPASITVFSQDQLDNRNITDASELAAFTPSLASNGRFGANSSSFAIRGFTQELRTTSSVGVYFAEVVAPRGGGSVPAGDGAGPGAFFDLQNVQVLKGPQGTLFGRNTTGGAILLVPHRPEDRFEGYAEASYGNYDMKRLQGVVNVPLSDDAALRIGADFMDQDGYLKNVSGIGPKRFGDTHYISARASLLVNLTPDLENYTIASFSRSSTNGPVPGMITCNPAAAPFGILACGTIDRQKNDGFYAVQSGVEDSYSIATQRQIINTTTWQMTDDIRLRNIVSYAQATNSQQSEVLGTHFILPASFGPIAGTPLTFTRQVPWAGNGRTNDQETMTEELQFQGTSLGGRLDWQAGAYYEESNPLSMTGTQSPFFLNCPDAMTFQCTDPLSALTGGAPFGSLGYQVGKMQFRNKALYSQATFKLTDKLSISGGIRYTWDNSASTSELAVYKISRAQNRYVLSCLNNPAVEVGSTAACSPSVATSTKAPTWMVGMEYKPIDDVLLYAKWSRGYRQGAVNPYGPPGFQSFDAEKVDTYEAGLKASFHGAVSGTFNLTGFYNDFTNQQLQAGVAAPVSTGIQPTVVIVNAGSSRIWGIEAEANITPFQGFNLSGSYAYLNTELLSIDLPDLSTIDSPFTQYNNVPSEGVALPYAPKHQLTATASYELPLSRDIGKVRVAATYSYTAKRIASYASANGILDAFETVNANLDWSSVAGSQFDLAVFATNLLNEKYYSSIGEQAPFFSYGFQGRPRTVGVRLKYNFGG